MASIRCAGPTRCASPASARERVLPLVRPRFTMFHVNPFCEHPLRGPSMCGALLVSFVRCHGGVTWPATMSCSKEHWINGAEERKGSGMAVAVRADIDGQTDGTERRAEFFSRLAVVGKAFASAKRLELVDLLAQGERAVDSLARQAGMGITTTSSHLQILKMAHVVSTRRAGTPRVLPAQRGRRGDAVCVARAGGPRPLRRCGAGARGLPGHRFARRRRADPAGRSDAAHRGWRRAGGRRAPGRGVRRRTHPRGALAALRRADRADRAARVARPQPRPGRLLPWCPLRDGPRRSPPARSRGSSCGSSGGRHARVAAVRVCRWRSTYEARHRSVHRSARMARPVVGRRRSGPASRSRSSSPSPPP
jgi:DNA-binding transcriptional ArsR family regulator